MSIWCIYGCPETVDMLRCNDPKWRFTAINCMDGNGAGTGSPVVLLRCADNALATPDKSLNASIFLRVIKLPPQVCVVNDRPH